MIAVLPCRRSITLWSMRDQIDTGLDTYGGLVHDDATRLSHAGSMNHLAILGIEYLDLSLQLRRNSPAEICASPFGLNGLVFGTEDPRALTPHCVSGVPGNRRSILRAGRELTEAHATRVPHRPCHAGTGAGGASTSVHHLMRDLVWRDEWRHHANGAIAIERAVIAAREPRRWARCSRGCSERTR